VKITAVVADNTFKAAQQGAAVAGNAAANSIIASLKAAHAGV